jgi:hypothetical protein
MGRHPCYVFFGAFGEGIEERRRELKQVAGEMFTRAAFAEKEPQEVWAWLNLLAP